MMTAIAAWVLVKRVAILQCELTLESFRECLWLAGGFPRPSSPVYVGQGRVWCREGGRAVEATGLGVGSRDCGGIGGYGASYKFSILLVESCCPLNCCDLCGPRLGGEASNNQSGLDMNVR
jgi:hypothetical protein